MKSPHTAAPEWPLLTTTRESLCTPTKTQCSQKYVFYILKSPKKKKKVLTHKIVHEVVTKTIPKKKKCKKAKGFSEEALQIAEKRREVKGKGERERHTHLNAEF